MKQTQRYLRSLFRERGLRPERKLGQCFLVDPNLHELVLRTAAPGPDDFVFEVGAGTGQLTRGLARAARSVLAVEIDERLHALAAEHLWDLGNVELLRGDVLASKRRLHPEVLRRLEAGTAAHGPCLLAANLPYHVALPVLQNFLAAGLPWARIAVTVQKELADRMTAGPERPKDYNAFTLLFQARARAEVVRRLAPSVFWPPPRVQSALVRAEPAPPLPPGFPFPLFEDLVRKAFLGRRKKLSNALAPWCASHGLHGPSLLERTGIDGDARPEDIGLQEYVSLACEAGRRRARGKGPIGT